VERAEEMLSHALAVAEHYYRAKRVNSENGNHKYDVAIRLLFSACDRATRLLILGILTDRRSLASADSIEAYLQRRRELMRSEFYKRCYPWQKIILQKWLID